MEKGQDFRQIVFKIAEANQTGKKHWLTFRETLDTAIFGTLSTSVGVVILLTMISAALGVQRNEWRALMGDGGVPSFSYGIAAVVGEALGLIGLGLGRLRGAAISPLSAVGTLLCLIQIYLFFIQFLMSSFS